MRRIAFFVFLLLQSGAVIMLALLGCERTKVFTVGIVNPNSGLEDVVGGFKSEMSKAGFTEGRDVTYLYGGPIAEARIDHELEQLSAKRVDLILAVGTLAARKAKEAVRGSRIPVVFAPVLFPVESGLVESMAHPGGNLTGVKSGGSTPKALEWHKIVFPRSKTLFVPCKCGDEAAELSMSDLRETAAKLGLKVVVAEIDSLDDLKHALDNIPAEADSLWLLNSPFLVTHTDIFVKAALKHKLPLSSGTSQYRTGVVLSYGQEPYRTGQQAGRLAGNILRGAQPGELPVETAEFFLGINLRTARGIGVNIADDILQQAHGIVRE